MYNKIEMELFRKNTSKIIGLNYKLRNLRDLGLSYEDKKIIDVFSEKDKLNVEMWSFIDENDIYSFDFTHKYIFEHRVFKNLINKILCIEYIEYKTRLLFDLLKSDNTRSCQKRNVMRLFLNKDIKLDEIISEHAKNYAKNIGLRKY